MYPGYEFIFYLKIFIINSKLIAMLLLKPPCSRLSLGMPVFSIPLPNDIK